MIKELHLNNITAFNIKELRRKLGFTQMSFARALGMNQPIISLYEKGKRKPSYRTALNILKLARSRGLEINLEYIRME